MPGPITHDIFYKELKKKLNSKTLRNFPNYDKYNIFAQGHDFLIYYNFYKIWKNKLEGNIELSVLLQENNFQEFIYNYLKCAKENGSIEKEDVRLFISAGYIMHHILDAYLHPLIIYYAGDHTPDPTRPTWMHGVVENLIDVYMLKKYDRKKQYQIYKDFHIDKKLISSDLIDTINKSASKTYRKELVGKKFEISFYQLELFMKIMKSDRLGVKRVLFDKLDSLYHGASSFSYNRDCKKAIPYLNETHEIWYNPYEPTLSSNKSFFELFDNALELGTYIVNELEEICESGIINKDDIYDLVPNINSVSGLECNKELKIKKVKQW